MARPLRLRQALITMHSEGATMKRFALLLAAVVSGSGCVVSSNPCERTLNVDWLFVSAAGTPDLTCTAAVIDTVDVYIDGALVAPVVPCTSYGASFSGYSEGAHEIMVEGFRGSTIINRDWYTVPSSCGDATFSASPGEGEIEFLTTPFTSGDFLLYKLWDDTRATPYVISSRTASTDHTFPVELGVYFNVPYGSYALDWIEERTFGGSLVRSLCFDTFVDVMSPGTTSTTVTLNGSAVCL
jgi:hypothetical protein